MLRYDMIIIGFGKGGKTLAAYFAQEGKRIAMVEENSLKPSVLLVQETLV